jgi:adenylate kinase family enzyme
MLKLKDIVLLFKGITTYALVGDSGTGKSFRAKLLAQKYDIDVILDDGLLIKEDKIIAGHSAKREKTYMGAIRVALFDDKQHRDEVAKALQKLKVKKILILGTSEKMIQKIAVRLQLPQPGNIIHIEEIATREEIDKAIRSRQVEGKHVIPVPAIEIKRNYPMIFFNAIRVFQK